MVAIDRFKRKDMSQKIQIYCKCGKGHMNETGLY
nr:MAG TPA: Headcase protein family protein [Caudoviricetes sp.]